MAIGETILGAVLQVVIDKLASPEVINFIRNSKFDQSLVDKLQSLMFATGKLLLDAEKKQMIDDPVKEWLDELRHWFYRAEEVIDEIATKALRSSLKSSLETPSLGSKVRKFVPSTFSSFKFNRNVTEKIKEIVSMLESMLAQKDVLGLKELSDGGAPLTTPRTTSSVMEDPKVFGRDQEREKLLKLLLSSEEADRNNFGVVAIVGMGGIGKTTVAKMLFNNTRLQQAFDLKAWVCVSDHFDIHRVTKSILESVTNASCSGSSDLNFLQNKLRSELANKKFIFVLDDVWNESYEHWQILQAPFSAGANGSKIIVTTRNEGVASTMCTNPPFTMNLLLDDDAWSLFSRHAFELGNVMSNPCLEPIGRKIVQRCRGLPLAIKALGGLLRWKRDSKEWEAILQSSLWDLPQDSNVIPALWLSYYHLPGHLKRCFSYCAIFPKDYKIHRNQLVRLWMAESFILPTDNQRRMEEEGENHLHQLVAKSFLEPTGESYVTMHDLMHDLAQGVSGNFFAGHRLGSPAKIPERARHFSYVTDAYETSSKFQAIDGTKYLRSFLGLAGAWTSQHYMTNKVSTMLIPSLSCLRVLSLSGNQNLGWLGLIECPKQLRYLDVSDTNVTLLPGWVSTLCNLQTLILSNCTNLERLPANMWRLVSLRHLDIRGATLLAQMPEQMSKLTSLQTLTDFIIGKSTGSGIQELRELQDIHGKFAIRGLQNVIVPGDAYAVNLSSRNLIEDLGLEFRWLQNADSEKHKEVLDSLEPPSDVKRLTIKNYAGMRFPKWLDPGCTIYKNMAFLCLHGCQYCITLPPLGQLPSLKTLEIEVMDSIKEVGHEFCGHGICVPFPSLETLSFKHMKGWDVWSHVDAEGCTVCLPRLTDLSVRDCPNLKGDFPVHAPSLVKLDIGGCGQLSRLLPRLASVHALEIATCHYNAELARGFDVTSITSLSLAGLVQLVSLPPEIVTLSSLHHLCIAACCNLKSLANLQLPPRLETLQIGACEALECLPERMELLTRLQNICLSECQCLRWIPRNSLPTCLKSLEVTSSGSCEFPIPTDRMHHYTSLERLCFGNAESQLVSFPLGSFTNLRSLRLWNCKGLEKVYVAEGKDDNSLTSLSELCISVCPKLEMIGKERGSGEATVLPAPNLTYLSIEGCEKVKPVLIERDGEVLLPKLEELTIDKSNSRKMISESPLSLRKNLVRFSCLRRLTVRDEEVECFPDRDHGWGSLPTSLIGLQIEKCRKLRKLDGKALQSLKHLEELWIEGCPKLESLPEEGLPPSLGQLRIKGCPMLEERCKPKKGKDWSKIHHIPYVEINRRCITGSDPY